MANAEWVTHLCVIKTGGYAMKKPQIVFLAILIIVSICLGIYFIPFPQRVQLVMYGAEVDVEGKVVDSGRMSIDGWIYHYLIQPDAFVLSDL